MVQFTVFYWSHPIINNDPLHLYGVIKCHCNILLPLFYFYCFGPQSAKKNGQLLLWSHNGIGYRSTSVVPITTCIACCLGPKASHVLLFWMWTVAKTTGAQTQHRFASYVKEVCKHFLRKKNDTCKIGKTLSFDILRLCLPSFLLELW